MSFWSESPGPHWSDWFFSSKEERATLIASPIRHEHPHYKDDVSIIKSGIKIIPFEVKYLVALSDFLRAHFVISAKSKCAISPHIIEAHLKLGWIIAIAIDNMSNIVGSVISRSLGDCSLLANGGRISTVKNTGFIDFFCVHPSYRNNRLGSSLLNAIDCFSSRQGRKVHFFQKEISPLYSLPPLWAGMYYARPTRGIKNPNVSITNMSFRGLSDITFHPQYITGDTQVFSYDSLHVIISDTFHVDENGGRIGEVIACYSGSNDTKAEHIEEILESTDYKIILMDSVIPRLDSKGWQKDSPYYIYCYNMNPRRFFDTRPAFIY